MPDNLVEEVEENEFGDFSLESIPAPMNISNKDISSTYISDVSEFTDTLETKNFSITEENITISKNTSFEQELEIETTYNTFKYIEETSEIKFAVDQCEDYNPPTNVGGVLIPPTPSVPRPPVITEYIFSGMDPLTKSFKIWISNDINSKRPADATVDYLHVGLIDTSKKAL